MSVLYQTRETGCRRILAAVVASWWAPEGWAFKVTYEEDKRLFWLKAEHREGIRAYTYRMHYSAEHIIHDHSDSGNELLRRKTQDAYRKALLGIGKEP